LLHKVPFDHWMRLSGRMTPSMFHGAPVLSAGDSADWLFAAPGPAGGAGKRPYDLSFPRAPATGAPFSGRVFAISANMVGVEVPKCSSPGYCEPIATLKHARTGRFDDPQKKG
jgi:hypothetical protein